jgi:Leucine-rich repeat (LRR) protein
MSNNRLHGLIPEDIVQLQNLQALHLDDNLLTGPIPAALQAIGSLKDL